MEFMDIIYGIIGFGFDVLFVMIRLVLAFIAGLIAAFKGRNFFFWGIITFLAPYLFFLVLIFPRKEPRVDSYLKQLEPFQGKNLVVASIMALAAIIAKADGTVSKKELLFIKQFIATNFRITEEEMKKYADAFEYGKEHPEEYREFARIVNVFYGRRRDIIMAIAYLFIMIGMQDDTISMEEETKIKHIFYEMGMSDYDYNNLKNSFGQGNSFYGSYGYTSHQGFGESQDSKVKKYCDILGVSEDATLAEIQKAYRKIQKEYHPDKVASQGMPESYKEFANNKIIEANEAYAYLKKMKS